MVMYLEQGSSAEMWQLEELELLLELLELLELEMPAGMCLNVAITARRKLILHLPGMPMSMPVVKSRPTLEGCGATLHSRRCMTSVSID